MIFENKFDTALLQTISDIQLPELKLSGFGMTCSSTVNGSGCSCCYTCAYGCNG